MKKLYKELYKACSDRKYKWKFSELSHFVSVKGRKYDQQKIRLLVIGRAVNGWGVSEEDAKTIFNDAESYGEYAEKSLKKNFDTWFELNEYGTIISNYIENGENKVYYFSKSAFWRTTEAIWKNLAGNDEPFWIDNIAWTNIYKLSPPITGNPTNSMCKDQRHICCEILKAEIEMYRPTHILLVTGYDWWLKNPEEDYNFIDLFTECNYSKDCIVLDTAHYSLSDGTSIPAVITCRPERKKHSVFVDSVIKAFELIS